VEATVMTAPIVGFQGGYRFLSNFWPVEAFGGSLTVEHLYQAAKCAVDDEARYVIGAPTPGEAKRRGRRASVRPDWDVVKYVVMRSLVTAKFTGSYQLGQRLVATGDAQLVEGNAWHDNFWGRCTCDRCVRAEIIGQNRLGEILMEARAQLAWLRDYGSTFDARTGLPR
jgi:ribA/ribD-fused uncharacterized protein